MDAKHSNGPSKKSESNNRAYKTKFFKSKYDFFVVEL